MTTHAYVDTFALTEWHKIPKNSSATALRCFASDTARIVFIHVPSVVKPVHIVMARNRVSISCLMSSVSIVFCVLIMFRYIFSAFTTNSVLVIKRALLLWSSPLSCSVALMSRLRMKRVCYCSWDISLVTLHALCSYMYHLWWSQCTSL